MKNSVNRSILSKMKELNVFENRLIAPSKVREEHITSYSNRTDVLRTFSFGLLIMLFMVSLSLTSLSAQNTFGVRLTESELQILQGGGSLIDRYDEQPYPRRLPNHPLTAPLKGRFPAHIYGDVFYLFQRTDSDSEQIYLLNALNQFLAFSKQKGIMYKSSSSGWITLLSESYTLSGANARRRIADNKFDTLPSSFVVYAYQRDYYFSGNRYRYEITSQAHGIKIKVINETSMKVKGIFKAINKERLEMEFYILTSGNSVCIYGIAFVEDVKNPVNVLGTLVDIPSAMSKRMSAIITWFKEQE